jgi:hypothetical protein
MANASARPFLFSSPRQGRRAHWQTVLEEFRRSGMSQAEFCRRRGIPPGTLSCWKHKLTRASGRGSRPAAGAPVPARPAFVPVQLTAAPPPSGTLPRGGVTAEGGALEIVLARSRRVRVRGRIDVQWLGQVIRTLETLGW